jgi:stage III sporulation protein AG
MMEEQEKRKKRSRGVLDFFRDRGKLWLPVVGVVLGALLLLLGSGYAKSEKVESDASFAESADELQTYRAALEKEVAAICDAVKGVSHVEVMVTLECGYRVTYTTDGDGDPVTVGSGSNQKALYRTLQPPAVSGVAVVCHGGDSPALQRTLTDLISTALGISANRVCVAGK